MQSDDGEDESSFATTDAEDKPKTKVGAKWKDTFS